MISLSSNIRASAVAKEAQPTAWLQARGSVAVGFSGGVDSAYLACVAVEALGRGAALAVIGRSASYPTVQWECAREVANQFTIPVLRVGPRRDSTGCGRRGYRTWSSLRKE